MSVELSRKLRSWTAEQKRFFRISMTEEGFSAELVLPGFLPAKEVGSVWVLTNDECTLAVTMMGRQDLRTSWGVMFTEIDGEVRTATGLVGPYQWSTSGAYEHHHRIVEECINRAIFRLAGCANWVDHSNNYEVCQRCMIAIHPEGGHRCGECGRDI